MVLNEPTTLQVNSSLRDALTAHAEHAGQQLVGHRQGVSASAVVAHQQPSLHEKITRHFETELTLWMGNTETHLIVAATFALADWGQPAIDEQYLISTSAQWLPVDNGFENQLIDRLVRERRAFDKSLGFNCKLPSNSVSAVLLDTPQAPVALALNRSRKGELKCTPSPTPNTWRWRLFEFDLPALPSREHCA